MTASIPTADLVVTVVNLVLAAVTSTISTWAAFRGLRAFRPLHAAVASLAVVYVVAYVWLLANYADSDPLVTWGKAMRGVSLAVWPTVWMGQAILSLKLQAAMTRASAAVVARNAGGDR